MALNPFIEILARALYNKDTSPIYVSNHEWDLGKDAVQFMNCRNYTANFTIKGNYIYMELSKEV
jgi:hypothetical protein